MSNVRVCGTIGGLLNIDSRLADHQWDLQPWQDVVDAVIKARVDAGFKPAMSTLLTWPEGNSKLSHGSVPIVGVSMLPHRLASQSVNMCVNSTIECRKFCLNDTGRGALSSVQRGRLWKTQLLVWNPNAWFTMLWNELELALKRYGPQYRARLNMFSDVAWEETFPSEFWDHFNNVLFQDYTKQWARHVTPRNYRIVYSASERTGGEYIELKLSTGASVAVVFDVRGRRAPLPSTWRGWPVIDGTVDDDLWSRPDRVVIGLRPRGALARADSPFKKGVA